MMGASAQRDQARRTGLGHGLLDAFALGVVSGAETGDARLLRRGGGDRADERDGSLLGPPAAPRTPLNTADRVEARNRTANP